MKCIIFAAGRGNRLRPHTDTIPKPLLTVKGRPIIHHLMDNLPITIDEYIIVVNYRAEQIIEYFKSHFHDLNVRFVVQDIHPGTYGALEVTKPLLDDTKFLVVSADDLYDKEELSKMISHKRAFGIQKKIMFGYHAIECSKDGKVESLRAPTEFEAIHGTPIATGAYVLDTEFFRFNPVQLRDGEYGLPQTIVANTHLYPVDCFYMHKWQPINTIRDLEVAQSV